MTVWDIASAMAKYTIPFNELNDLDYAPTNNILAVWEENIASFWAVDETGLTALGEFAIPGPYQWGEQFTLSPDGELLVLTMPDGIGQAIVLRRTNGEVCMN
ncbi:MAG: hypothetical protein IPL28_08115 [Chloroflexi bacterium]|nr:hypothetical protein [Chloroflexota bacterium]